MHPSALALFLSLALLLAGCGGSGADAPTDTADADTTPFDAVVPDLALPDTATPDATAPDAPDPDDAAGEVPVVCPAASCTVPDVTKCEDPATRVTCLDPDGDGCFDWGEPQACEAGTVCSNGACGATCTSECTVPGATKCEGVAVLTCDDRNGDACLEWGKPSPCPAGLACSGGVCASACTSECTFDGQVRCDGDAVATCGDRNGDGCFEWGTPVPCAPGWACAGGACLEQCQSECDPAGVTACFASAVATCDDGNGDGCLTWGTPVPCAEGQACVDVAPGAGDGGQAGCTGTPIPTGVRLNEVYYDAEGPDTDSFVELHGPAGTSLAGFSLVAVNGADAQDGTPVVLQGSLGADGLFVVVQDTADDAWKALADQLSPDVDLPNGPDSVQLRFGSVVVDALAWGTFAPDQFPAGEGAPAPDVQGDSLGRTPDGADTNANAADFTPQLPSPGASNAGPDLCYAVVCETPTPAACTDPSTLRVHLSPGTCSAGACTYPDVIDVPCADGCEVDHCKGQVPKAAGDILITEVMPKASDVNPDPGEWFELHNPGAIPLDLAGCLLADANPPGVPITKSVVIPGGGYVVLAVSGSPTINFGLPSPLVYTGFALSNEGEPLSLSCGAVLIDRVAWTANMVVGGVATQLSADRLSAAANDDPAAWCPATATYGTTGRKGTPGAPNGTCPPVTPGATPDAAGQLVVTELMAKSQAGGGDKGEWFELYNASDVTLDLNGCWLSDKTADQFQFVEPVVVPPGAYRVLALSNDPAVNFGLPDPYVYGGFNLSNTGEPLSLACGGTIIDAVTFTVDWAVEGVAFQLSSAHLDAQANDDAANWCTATANYGTAGKKGTPGGANLACP